MIRVQIPAAAPHIHKEDIMRPRLIRQQRHVITPEEAIGWGVSVQRDMIEPIHDELVAQLQERDYTPQPYHASPIKAMGYVHKPTPLGKEPLLLDMGGNTLYDRLLFSIVVRGVDTNTKLDDLVLSVLYRYDVLDPVPYIHPQRNVAPGTKVYALIPKVSLPDRELVSTHASRSLFDLQSA